jgi:hypothetical protein
MPEPSVYEGRRSPNPPVGCLRLVWLAVTAVVAGGALCMKACNLDRPPRAPVGDLAKSNTGGSPPIDAWPVVDAHARLKEKFAEIPKYRGVRLSVTGEVRSVEPDKPSKGAAVVTIRPGYSGGEVEAIFAPGTADQTKSLRPGDRVTVQGKYSLGGWNRDRGFVMLTDCEFQ